jgi:hypothetical protein
MKKNFISNCFPSAITLVLVSVLISVQSFGQPDQPASSGLAPVNGVQVFYEIHGQGEPVILLHGAYMTNSLNWGQLYCARGKFVSCLPMGEVTILPLVKYNS